ncbi:MAG: methanogenesis marker 12 protein [Candidatus Hydrothermarchaeales archaeon]
MNTLGIDHGTQSIRFCALGSGDQEIKFEIGREEAAKRSILEEIKKRVSFSIDMVGVTYSMGDAINGVVDLHRVMDRGLIKESTGNYIGGGTKVFDEIYKSDLNAVLIPGLHRGIECLDPRFKALYSHCAASEKVSLSYHIFLEVNKTSKVDNLIISDISSNTVTIGIKDGKFFGAMDACLGAVGLLHGPLDLGAIRRVDDGKISANEAFYTSGAIKILKDDLNKIFNSNNEKAKLALDSLILSVTMEICSFLGAFKPETIVITGSAGVNDKVYNALKEAVERFGSVQKINGFSAAKGGAQIAMSVLKGQKDVLGIPIKF